MHFVELSSIKKYLIRLEKGDEVLSSVKDFCAGKNILSASLFAIGAISGVSLALYELDKKEYFRKSFSGAFEIASMSGNISRLGDEYIAHFHGVFSNKEFGTIAGHIDNATVSATCEIILESYKNEIQRKRNKEIGLNLLDLSN
jgi:predicted DNA-binding protein with PD1-like motif